MLLQELERARPGDLRGGLVVAGALVAMETMRRVRIGIDLALRALPFDHLDVAHRDALILLAEMHLHRDLRLFVRELGDLAAIVGDRGGQASKPRRCQECDAASHAEADDGDRAFLLEFVNRRLSVLEHRIPIRTGNELARVGDLIRRVAALEALLAAIEQGRRDRGVAFLGEPVTDGANVMIDAKNLLNDHDSALGRTGGVGAIGAQLVAVAGGEREMLAQVFLAQVFLLSTKRGTLLSMHDFTLARKRMWQYQGSDACGIAARYKPETIP